MSDFGFRFGGIGRLYGAQGLERLRAARVCVVGVGGVGSWAAEALARSGVGALALVDLDEVCASNVNRQLHALDGAIGQPKVTVMASRITAINPECAVEAIQDFFTPQTADSILRGKLDCVLDAIDNVPNKCLLIARCRELGIPVVTVGGAGGRCNPTLVRTADLAFSSHDNLLQQVRRRLRDEFQFSREPKTPFGVPCVYSTESPRFPQSDGTVCATKEPGADLRLNCNNGYGTASFVTGVFGFAAAAQVVSMLVKTDNPNNG